MQAKTVATTAVWRHFNISEKDTWVVFAKHVMLKFKNF